MNGICKCTKTTVVTPPSCNKPECLGVPHLLVKETDQGLKIYPCNQNILIDLHDDISPSNYYPTDILNIRVTSHSPNLRNVEFLTNQDKTVIQLSAVSNYQGQPSLDFKFAKVTFEVTQGLLTQTGSLTIIYGNVCDDLPKEEGRYCHPCNGYQDEIIITNTQGEVSVSS